MQSVGNNSWVGNNTWVIHGLSTTGINAHQQQPSSRSFPTTAGECKVRCPEHWPGNSANGFVYKAGNMYKYMYTNVCIETL